MQQRPSVVRVVLNTMKLQVSSETCCRITCFRFWHWMPWKLPCRMDAREIRREKTKVLSARLGEKLICGQYDSTVLKRALILSIVLLPLLTGDIYIDNWRWKGVPFYFMTGKKMPYQCVEVVIKLKAPPVGLFEGETPGRIVMRLQPHAHLDIQIDVKSPGMSEEVELATLTHRYPDWLGVDGYEKLLYDALYADQSHFVHSEEVLESWRIVSDLLCVGDKCPIRTTFLTSIKKDCGVRFIR